MIQLVGSRSEAKNYRSWIQVGDPDHEVVHTYKGKIMCIDDKVFDLFDDRVGMFIGITDKSKMWQDEGDGWHSVNVEIEMEKVGPQEEPSNNNEKKG